MTVPADNVNAVIPPKAPFEATSPLIVSSWVPVLVIDPLVTGPDRVRFCSVLTVRDAAPRSTDPESVRSPSQVPPVNVPSFHVLSRSCAVEPASLIGLESTRALLSEKRRPPEISKVAAPRALFTPSNSRASLPESLTRLAAVQFDCAAMMAMFLVAPCMSITSPAGSPACPVTVLAARSPTQGDPVPESMIRDAPASTALIVTAPAVCVKLKSPFVVIAPPLSVGLLLPKIIEGI